VELGDRHSGITPLKEAKDGTGFAKSWDGWLKQVSLQVHAAVDLARGLPAAKKERLDGILGNDVVRLRSLWYRVGNDVVPYRFVPPSCSPLNMCVMFARVPHFPTT